MQIGAICIMLMIQAWGSWKPPPTVVYCLSMKGKWFFRFSEITLISVKVVFCTYNTQFFAAHVWEGLNLGVGKLRRRLSWLNEEGRNWLVCVPDTGSASWSHIARRRVFVHSFIGVGWVSTASLCYAEYRHFTTSGRPVENIFFSVIENI